MKLKPKSAIINKVLTSALWLWLRSQLQQIQDLQIKITGSDRQIFSGYVPGIFLATNYAIYQGLHLSQVQIRGENIRINLGQIIKGKPLRLLEPIPVTGQLRLEEADLKASLQSPLLSTALTDLLLALLEAGGIANPTHVLQDWQISWQEVAINTDKLTLYGILTDVAGNTTPLIIRTGLQLASGHQLRLHPLHIEGSPELKSVSLSEFQIDLGSEVKLEELSLTSGQLFIRGGLTVIP